MHHRTHAKPQGHCITQSPLQQKNGSTERERERDKDRERERQRKRERDRETETQRDATQRDSEREGQIT